MNWMINYEDSLSHHGVEGQKWGVMHGPPYPLTGENKKAFKADKKAFYKAEKKAGKVNTSHATEEYGHAVSRANALKEAGFWMDYAGKLTGDKKTLSKANLYNQASKKYEKYADTQYKNTEHGKRAHDERSSFYKMTAMANAIIGGGAISMLALAGLDAIPIAALPLSAALVGSIIGTKEFERAFKRDKYTYGLEAAQTFSSKKYSNKQLDNLIKEELKSSNYNSFDDPNELNKALEDMLKVMPQNNTNALDPYTQHKPVKVKMT